MTRDESSLRGKYYDAIDPATGRAVLRVLVPKTRIDWAARIGVGALLELDECVSAVLLRPTAIFSGLRRDVDDDRGQTDGWLCYCGTPAKRFEPATGAIIPIRRRVLTVFVNRECVNYAHRWEEADPEDPGLPSDGGPDRFKERLL